MRVLEDIERAVHTVLHEIPEASVSDQLDAVYGVIGNEQVFRTYEDQIKARLEALR